MDSFGPSRPIRIRFYESTILCVCYCDRSNSLQSFLPLFDSVVARLLSDLSLSSYDLPFLCSKYALIVGLRLASVRPHHLLAVLECGIPLGVYLSACTVLMNLLSTRPVKLVVITG